MVNMGDIWGAVDKPKRKKPDVVPTEHESHWIAYHMKCLHEWVTENMALSPEIINDIDICRILVCGSSELNDIVDNVTNNFSLARIKQIHINLTNAKVEGRA